MRNEKKFYDALERIFTGANISGEGGYINLLKIKHDYYKIILEQFKKDIDADTTITSNDSFKEELFNRLYSFFEKYFSESGSVYFVKTENWQKIYERVYTDNKDVILFWKTNMLYYVKSDILFNNMEVKIECEETKQQYNFFFNVEGLKNKENNNKNDLVFSFTKIKQEKVNEGAANDNRKNNLYVFDVSYSTHGRITKLNDIIKSTIIPEDIINKAFRTFRKQSEVDFFINKNAKQFLTEQLDLYLHQIMLNDENKFDAERLNQLKTIKNFAHKIINFISQFENELVEVWNKPKFVFNSNYVITLDKLSSEIIKKISQHKNLPKQITEWKELGMVENSFNFTKRDKDKQFLPIDTKYFKDLEVKVLNIFGNIDESLDGRLIHSENYQALNTLQKKYVEKVKCIYIDPPFNTGGDFDYIDKFQEASWLSFMQDRLQLSKKFLSKEGGLFLHLDRNANFLGRIMLNNIYGSENFKADISWDTCGDTGFKSSKKNWIQNSNTIIHFAKNIDTFSFNKLYKLLNVKEPSKVKEERTKNKIGWLDVLKDQNDFYVEQYNSSNTLVRRKVEFESKVEPIGMIWSDILTFLYTQVGNNESYFFKGGQKPEHLIRRFLQAQTNPDDYILDFFMGSGTTCAVAKKLSRKFLGIEMEDTFNTFYYQNGKKKIGVLGRMKIVLGGDSTFNVFTSIRHPQLTRNLNYQGSGFFKYYELEQYENTLQQMKYRDNLPNSIWDTKDPFTQYIFYADKKFADVLSVKDKNIKLDFDKLYPNIDFAETISNLLGLPIKKITDDSVILIDEGKEKAIKTDYKKMTNEERLEFARLLKPLLWWGE